VQTVTNEWKMQHEDTETKKKTVLHVVKAVARAKTKNEYNI